MINRIKISAVAVALFSTVGVSGEAAAQLQVVTLPDPVGNSFLYGDFYSYSLPILAYKYDQAFGGGVGPSNPFYVASAPGQIQDGIVVATGTNNPNTIENFAGMDNAYATPSGPDNGASTSTIFRTGDASFAPDPGQVSAFTGDQTNTWDSTLTALSTFLNGGIPIFYFNNNQTSSGSAADQNLFAWGQVAIRDIQGALPTLYFDLTSIPKDNTGIPVINAGINPSIYNSPGAADTVFPFPSDGAPDTFPLAGDFVLSGGQVCTNADATLIVPCNAPGAVTFNHNLGANQAAYAVISPEVNDILGMPNFGGYDVMSIDFRMYGLNNGFEQLFILPGSVVPEPGTIALLGMGVASLGLAGVIRRRKGKV